jgi:hypothetical protein
VESFPVRVPSILALPSASAADFDGVSASQPCVTASQGPAVLRSSQSLSDGLLQPSMSLLNALSSQWPETPRDVADADSAPPVAALAAAPVRGRAPAVVPVDVPAQLGKRGGRS